MAMFLCLVLVGNLFPTAAFSCDSAEEEALIQKLPGLEIQHQWHQSLSSLEDAGTLSSFHGGEKVRVLERWLNVKERQDIRDSEYAKTHFVIYRNRGGFNNRLENLELAFLMAVLLNRTLVVHNFSAFHGGAEGEVAPETYLDMQAFQWPVKQWSEVNFATPPRNHSVLTRKYRHCGLDIVQLCEEMRKGKFSEIPMIMAHDGRGIYPYWTTLFAKQYHEVIRNFGTEHVRFNPSLCDFTQNSLQSQTWLRQPYAAMHFRLGDRPGLQMANCSLFGFRFQGHLKDINENMSIAEREAIKYGCNKPSAKDPKNHVIPLFTEDVVRSWHLPKNIKVVYIATNEPNDTRVKTVQGMFQERGLTTLTWEDLNHTLAPARDGTEISIQEQCIAIRSKFFWPSWPSTWDAEVIYRRLDGTNVDAEIHFELLSDSVSRFWHMRGIKDC